MEIAPGTGRIGSKSKSQGSAGSLWFHLPSCQLGTCFGAIATGRIGLEEKQHMKVGRVCCLVYIEANRLRNTLQAHCVRALDSKTPVKVFQHLEPKPVLYTFPVEQSWSRLRNCIVKPLQQNTVTPARAFGSQREQPLLSSSSSFDDNGDP